MTAKTEYAVISGMPVPETRGRKRPSDDERERRGRILQRALAALRSGTARSFAAAVDPFVTEFLNLKDIDAKTYINTKTYMAKLLSKMAKHSDDVKRTTFLV